MERAELESLLALARYGSFTRAAQELGLTQSAVTRHIQRLEGELGTVLVTRARTGQRLTAAGERVRAYAEETLAREAALRQALRSNPAELAGSLCIIASTTPGEFVAPGLLAAFVSRHPRIRPEVRITDTATAIEELQAGRWDAGFVGARLPAPGLDYLRLLDDEVVLIAPAAHPFAGRNSVPLAELAGQPCVEREDGSGTMLSVRRILAERGTALPETRTVMVLSSTDAIVSAVEAGHGLGWVSSLALEHRRAGGVAVVRLAGLPLRRPLYFVSRPAETLSPLTAAFRQWVKASAIPPPDNASGPAQARLLPGIAPAGEHASRQHNPGTRQDAA